MTTFARILGRISDIVDQLLRLLAMVCLAVMVLTIALQVVARYGFAAPPAWTEELARYAMVWVGLLGASVSFKAGFDPKLVTLSPTLPGPVLGAAAVLRGAAVVLFLGPILFYCFFGPGLNPGRSFLARSLYTTAESFDMPLIFVTITVPVFITAIFLHGAAQCARGLAQRRNPAAAAVAH